MLLHHRFGCPEDRASSVSVLKDNSENIVEKKKTSLTMFFCNASARCCAPSSPIWLNQSLSVVSVCTNVQIDSTIVECFSEVVLFSLGSVSCIHKISCDSFGQLGNKCSVLGRMHYQSLRTEGHSL